MTFSCRLTQQVEAAERAAAFYRPQVGLEARMGLALSRIAG